MKPHFRLCCFLLVVVAVSCARDGEDHSAALPTGSADAAVAPTSSGAAAALAALRGRFSNRPQEPISDPAEAPSIAWTPLPPGEAERFTVEDNGLRPHFANPPSDDTARLLLPRRATLPWRLETADFAAVAEIALTDVRDVAAESADGYVVYRAAHVSGATILHRALPNGTEDFVSFESRPNIAEVAYKIRMVKGTTALRLVENTLELLDKHGAPRFRVAPPFLLDADGKISSAVTSIEGCAVDQDPAPPWDRPVTQLDADTCTLRVSWSSDNLKYPALLDPTWTTTGAMMTARQAHTATTLSNGKILVAGGLDASGALLSSAELFDPTTKSWTTTGSLLAPAGVSGARQLHMAVQLSTSSNSTTSGKVLVAGGKSGTSSLATSQLYNPSTGTWATAAAMNLARHQASATLLANGKVLLAGGFSGSSPQATAALYDPATGTGTWAATPSMTTARIGHTATRLVAPNNNTLNNKVLVAGGSNGTTSVTSVQLFDGTAWTTPSTIQLTTAREGHTATLLTSNNKVLVAGGKTVTSSGTTIQNTALLFDPTSGSGTWGSGGTMTARREKHSATLLSSTVVGNGQVLIAGGSNATTSTLDTAELYAISSNSWAATATLLSKTKGHTANLAGSGFVLLAGGVNDTTVTGSELYDPSRALGCTTNAQCATGVCANNVCCDKACAGPCSGCNLSGSVGTCATVPTDDQNPCTADSCDPVAGVKHTPVTNGTPCSDSNACTQTDTCQNGVCTGTNPVVCPLPDQCHTAGTCNTATGMCSNPAKSEGTPCNVGNVCASSQSCLGGTCTGSPSTCAITFFCQTGGAACCPAGFTNVVLTPNDDVFQTGIPNQCIAGMGGRDTIGAQGGHSVVITGPGDDTIQGANGNNFVAPGAGADTVMTGVGDDTLAIFDICEMDRGKTIDLGTGNNTLIAPLPLADMQAKGLNIANVQNVIVQGNSCKSLCSIKPDCNGNGDCQEGAAPGQMGCLCHPGFNGANCEIPPPGTIPPGGKCTSDVDCVTGLVCGTNNGACFGRARKDRTCWSPTCEGGGNASACGDANSACGQNCACATGCDATNPNAVCPSGEVCKARLGALFEAPFADACVDPRCPSDDATLCGRPTALCGMACVCKPDCSSATCAHPQDGCGGLCPGVCRDGDTGCTDDVNCPEGFSCFPAADGTRTCRPGDCAYRILAPPLCGVAGARCGDACPACTPRCDGRHCGPDPNCGTSCGTCGDGTYCSAAGECVPPTSDPPISVPNGSGGQRTIVDLTEPPPSDVGALKGMFSVSEQGTSEYTVPIDVPPGRAGMEPALTLKYSGSRVNEELGIGWSLQGLSKITRCPRSQALDGYSHPIRNDTTDHFCIDGKRLEAVPGVSGQPIGLYGANGTEYRTLIDSFSRVVSFVDGGAGIQLDQWPAIARILRSLQGPDSFKVFTKDGRILTFGGTRDSLVLGRNGIRYSWLLTRVEDRAGNTMSISYTNLGALLPVIYSIGVPNVVRPSLISYTGHGSDPGNRHVRFDYETRTDPQHKFMQGGVPLMADARLARITTSVNDVPVKNYHLVYGDGPLSQISKIYECTRADDTHCKAPTQFDYQAESGFTFGFGPGLDDAGQLDANGDGIPDYLATKLIVHPVDASVWLAAAEILSDVAIGVGSGFLSGGAGFAVTSVWSAAKGPFFGLFANNPEIEIVRTMYLGTGDRAQPTRFVGNVQGIPCDGRTATWFVDYDRDGKDDVVVACGDENILNLFVARSKGDGNFESDGSVVATVPKRDRSRCQAGRPCQDVPLEPRPTLFDIDGDSLQDLVYCKDAVTLALRRRLGPMQGFESPPIELASPSFCTGVPLPPTGGAHPLFPGSRPTYNIFDVDGDGTPDLVVRGPDSWQVLRFFVSAGGRTLQWEPVNLPDVGPSTTGDGMSLADLNGDGLLDIYRGTGDQAVIWLNGADRRFSSRTLHRPQPALDLHDEFGPFSFQQFAFADNNADGRIDLLEAWQTPLVDLGNGAFSRHYFNVAFFADSLVTRLDPSDPNLLWPKGGLINPNMLVPGTFRASGDLDGDGNLDLFGYQSGAAFYGAGLRNHLLSHVVDGLGNLTTIAYDENNTNEDPELRTYHTDDACKVQAWPETCLKRMNGLVSSYREGYVALDGREVIERSSQHHYRNARMNVTGEGWLGFDRRTVRSVAADGSSTGTLLERVVTTEYEPVARYDRNGTLIVGTATLAAPYLYPLAGLPKTIITDDYPGRSNQIDLRPPGHTAIENGLFNRRTRIENAWQVRVSAFGRPFPFMFIRTTKTFDRPIPASADPLPFDDNGTLLTHCVEDSETDAYGNIVMSEGQCQPEGEGFEETNRTDTFIVPDPVNWLISNPKQIHVVSSRDGDQASQTWKLGYYPNGLLESVTRLGDTSQQHTSTYTRDDFGNATQILEEVAFEPSRTNAITYDVDNIFPTTTRNAKNQPTLVGVDARFGTPKTVADPNGIVIQWGYDDFGRLIETRSPEGTIIATYANALNAPVGHLQHVQVTVERQGTLGTRTGSVTREYDHHGQLVKTRSEGLGGADVIQQQTYDTLLRISSSTLPHTADATAVPTDGYSYDRLGRLARVDHSDPHHTFREYQYASSATLASDKLTKWTDGMACGGLSTSLCAVNFVRSFDEEGRENVIISDHRGLVRRSIDGDNVETTTHSSNYTHGAFNRLVDARDNQDHINHFDYDDYGRKIGFTDPDTGPTSSTYNGFDEIGTTTDPKHQTRTYHHDALGRIERIDDPAGATQWIYDQGTNALGRLSESISPATPENPNGNHVAYTYEAPTATANRGFVHQVATTLDGVGYLTTFDYDDLGRTDSVHYPNLGTGAPIVAQSHYDTSGILTEVDEIGSNATKPLWQLKEAFQAHLVQRETFGNGASTIYGYNPDRRWLESLQTTQSSSTVQSLEYTHWNNGPVHLRTTSTETREHTYDNLNRLSSTLDTLPNGSTQSTSYGYDSIGNITTRASTVLTYLPNQPHLLDTAGANSYHYDLNGNVSQRSGPDVPSGFQSFDYAPFDLPSAIHNGSGANAKTTQFEYTADETRAVRRDPDMTRYSVGDHYERLVDSSGSTLEERFRLYVGSRQLGEIVRKNGADQTLFFHADHLGSVVTITNDSQASFNQEFDPFGTQIDPVSSAVTRAGFTGHEHDADLGLIDMKGRIYDPLAARFTSADPLMQVPFWSQGLNRYSYVFNDPINNVDPTGMVSEGVGAWEFCGECAPAASSSSGFGALGGLLGAGSNVAESLLGGGLGGAKPGGSYEITPTAAPTSAPTGQGSMHATAQNRGGVGPDDAGPARTPPPSVAQGQTRVDKAYDELGLEYGKRPTFNPEHTRSHASTERTGVEVGPSALESEAQLKTTLIHESIHPIQWREGRLGAFGVHRTASELEARLRQLESANVAKAGLSPEMVDQLVEDVRQKINALFAFKADRYVFDVLVFGRATPPAQFVMKDPAPWMFLAR